MTRTVGSSGVKTERNIREAGLRLIYQYGYEAASLRQLASEVGLQQGSLYNYFRNKQDLLFTLINDHMQDLLRNVDATLKNSVAARERLEVFVRFHIDYHMRRKHEVFISYSEMRSLSDENRQVIVSLRQEYEKRLVSILDQGRAEGVFNPADTKVAAFGILSMLSGISTWFNPRGRLSKKEVSFIFVKMVIGSVTWNEGEEVETKSRQLTGVGTAAE
jgi:AcrR family transcriptional regulator